MVGNMNYHFSVVIAKEVGVDGAIMLENMHYWIVVNKANNRNIYDGEAWTYNTKKAFSELFPFWSEKQIRRILDNLIKDGYLKTGNYNKSSYDRTLWYTLTEKGWNLWNFNISPNGPIVQTEQANEMDQMGQPIPYKKPNKKNNTNKEPRHKYGEYKNILLTDKELEKLISDYGKPIIDEYIKKMDEWIELNGKRYKNYNLALRKWLGNAKIQPSKSITKKEGDNTYDEEYFKSLLNKDNRL